MKKHCWEIHSSPHDIKLFFCNQTLNSQFKSSFFSCSTQSSPLLRMSFSWREIREIQSCKIFFLYLMFHFLISQSQLIYYPNKTCSIHQFHFFLFSNKAKFTKQPILSKDAIWLVSWVFRVAYLYFCFLQFPLKITAEVCCKEYNQLIDRV